MGKLNHLPPFCHSQFRHLHGHRGTEGHKEEGMANAKGDEAGFVEGRLLVLDVPKDEKHTDQAVNGNHEQGGDDHVAANDGQQLEAKCTLKCDN